MHSVTSKTCEFWFKDSRGCLREDNCKYLQKSTEMGKSTGYKIRWENYYNHQKEEQESMEINEVNTNKDENKIK